MMRRLPWTILAALWACACGTPESPRPDPHSFARPDEAVMTHLSLDIDVDFDSHVVSGRATLDLDITPGAKFLWLDTHELTILGVHDQAGQELEFEFSSPDSVLGTALRIALPSASTQVAIDYRSSPQAQALLWLSKEQTHDKRSPFVFSQDQSIYARTWIPCQDSPGIRFTYEARVQVPPGLMALMSAENPTAIRPDGLYTFEMDQPVPAYLLALAAGDLAFQALSETCGVYAEPGLLAAAAWEFEQTPAMMVAIEQMYGAYPWGRYDILVLPPYFPYGGMENPRLTFATPTLLAGDRSLVTLIAHELAHSWSGNLVTNRTWGDLWLNEGFTVYLERRIMEQLEGAAYAEMLASLGRSDLDGERERLGEEHPDLQLAMDLSGRHPDDSFSDVAYEKGYFFLRRVEELVGRERFDAFLRDYFARHAFGTIDTPTLLEELHRELFAGFPDAWTALDAQAWAYSGAFPDGMAEVEPAEFARVDAHRERWLAGGALPEPDGWTTHHWLHFLRGLPPELEASRLAELDDAFALSASRNAEILNVWCQAAIRAWYEPAFPAMSAFLEGMGRGKFLRPIYLRLAETERGLQMAHTIYARARGHYHPLVVRTLDTVLTWPPATHP